MIKPRALRPGDEVRVVTPASPISEDDLRAGVELLEGEGYRVTFGKYLWERDGYLAGTDAQRAEDLQKAFFDPGVSAVMCSRGGYGAARLLPMLDLDRMAESGRMFCGFSDVTTLHLALNRRGLVTYHTPMPITLSAPREPWVIDSFKRLLKGDATIPQEAPKGETIVPGVAEGPVVGGCLCLLTDSLGTPESLDCDGKILIIEDVDENPHRVDAMLTALRNSGTIQKAAGIAVGEMTRTDETGDQKIGLWPWKKIVRDRLGDLGIPAMMGLPFGHMKTMLSLPLGIRARLDATEGTLTYLESPCA